MGTAGEVEADREYDGEIESDNEEVGVRNFELLHVLTEFGGSSGTLIDGHPGQH
jgi:hypothetical protein